MTMPLRRWMFLGTLAGLLLVAAAAPTLAAEGGEFDHSHAAWTEVLRTHVADDRFDYARLKKSPAKLNSYLERLQDVTQKEMEGWSKKQRFAFWINAYNAFTVELITDHYPLKSIKKLNTGLGLKSVFDREFIPLPALHPEGKDDELSLNDIEHGILRPRFRDARVHAAVNCASFSCPPLRNEAFVAEKLDEQLDQQMRSFVADSRRNRFEHDRGVFRASEIFKWFEEDFARDAKSVRAYLIRFAPEEEKGFLQKAKIKFIDYGWDLNDVERD